MLQTFLRLALLLSFTSTCFAAGGTCPSGASYTNPLAPQGASVTIASLGITSCYFIAANGSDSNTGTSETGSGPWLHAPFMPNCSGTCLTVQNTLSGTAAAGSGFIFRGGDTWHYGLATAPAVGGPWNLSSPPFPFGTPTNPIYIGVDQTWFSGAFWVRPIMTGDNPPCNGLTLGSNCHSGVDSFGVTFYYVDTCTGAQLGGSNNMFNISGLDYYIEDNIEWTGLCQSGGQIQGNNTFIRYGSLCNQLCSGNTSPFVITNNYIHGASHLKYAFPNSNPGCTTSVVCFDMFAFQGSAINGFPGEIVANTIVDFSDSDPSGVGLCFAGFYNVAYNVFRYTSQCIPNPLHVFHDNLYEFFFENGHSNTLEDVGEAGGAANAIYSNLFRHIEATITSGGGTFLWLAPPTSGTTDYAFNNLAYDVGNLQYLNQGGTAGNNALGNYTFFNNTWQSNFAQPILRCTGYTNGAVNDVNNHYIDDQGYVLGPCTTLTSTTPLLMSNATATTNGYTSSQTFAYSPVASNSPTVGVGTNKNSTYCAALSTAASTDSTLSDAASACANDTRYACTYNTSNHTVSCPARTAVARPTSWDVGTYQFSSSTIVATPTFSPIAGTYSSAQSVTISSTTGSATFCYTLDGSTPTANGAGVCTHGTTFTVPIVISSAKTLKAVGTESGFNDSLVATGVFVINIPSVAPGVAIFSRAAR